jgi:hypothetical protein
MQLFRGYGAPCGPRALTSMDALGVAHSTIWVAEGFGAMIAIVAGRTDRYGLLVMEPGTSAWTARKRKNAEFGGFCNFVL